MGKKDKPGRARWSKSDLEALIARAVADAQTPEEEQMAFQQAMEEHVKFPFKTAWLGVTVEVTGIDVTSEDELVAVCVRKDQRQTVPLLDLPLPTPWPEGAEWIEAYRLWSSE